MKHDASEIETIKLEAIKAIADSLRERGFVASSWILLIRMYPFWWKN